MSEKDRFGDLGAGGDRRAEIGRALEERDRTHPEPGARRPNVPRASNKYAWLVGILMLMILGMVLFFNTLPNRGEGLEGPASGSMLRDFAAPSAAGDLEGDANVCQKAPCPENSGEKPACTLTSEAVVNVCTLREQPLVLTVIFDRGADCYPQVDRTERIRGDFEDVNFATLFFTSKERGEVRSLARARGWEQPVGVDRDGAVANLYGVGGCPTTIFVRAGGRVYDTRLGNLTESQLRRLAGRITG